MLKFVSGDFFDFDASIRVNTVNCVGVMGAGVALEFKKRYPDMYKDYVHRCKSGEIKPGIPTVWKSSNFFDENIEIVNFPTKNHWRRPSKYEYIEQGLEWLSQFLSNRPDATVTLPALGCGHGGLDWKIVKELINRHLEFTPANVLVFEPSASRKLTSINPIASSIDLAELLIRENITTISKDSNNYPEALLSYTEKNLYLYGSLAKKIDFDISIISSSKPEPDERLFLNFLLTECHKKNLSVLFGGSSIDKKLALRYATAGLSSGVFLPSGIILSAKKLKNSFLPNLSLISIGSPDVEFNRKEYLPSIISRSLLATTTIFTIKNFEWISKYKEQYKNSKNKQYFVNYTELSKVNLQAATEAKLMTLDPSLPNLPF